MGAGRHLGQELACPPEALALHQHFALSYTEQMRNNHDSKGVGSMIVLDTAALVGLAAVITSVSALVWSLRRRR